MMTIGGGSVTEGNNRRILTIPPPSQLGYFTARTAPSRVAKELVRSPPRVHMASSRVHIEASVTGPPACYTRSGKSSMRTTTSNSTEKNTIAARVESGEHLMRMVKVVAQMKGKMIHT